MLPSVGVEPGMLGAGGAFGRRPGVYHQSRRKVPKIATIESSRVVPQPQAQGRHEQDVYHVKVEIGVNVAGQTSTYIFNCIHSGALTVSQPLGLGAK
jgi:hypothetical protein